MTDKEQENILEKAKTLYEKITSSNALQEEKDAMTLVLNQIMTDIQSLETSPTTF